MLNTLRTLQFILLFLLSSQTFAQAYKILSFDSEITLMINGEVEIHEVITVDFNESRRGIMRDIPRKINIDGKIIKVKLSDVFVRDYDFKQLADKQNYTIRIGNPDVYLTGIQRYDLHYKLNHILIREEDHTAFQYNVIADWDTTIDSVNYSVTLPKSLDIRYNNYRVITGADGANERNATIEKNENTIYGHSLSRLDPEENITVAIKFPADYFEFPPPPVPAYKRDKLWYLPIGMIILMISFFRKNRQPSVDPSSGMVQYPPDKLSPAELGTFIDGSANVRDFVSLLPYWADKNYIKILGADEPGQEYVLFFRKCEDLPSHYPEYQQILFRAFFEDEELISLADLKDKLAKVYYSAAKAIKTELRGKDLYDASEKALFHSRNMVFASIISLAAALFFIIKMSWILTGIGLIFFAIILIILFAFPVKKSEKGQRLFYEIKSLKSFLEDGSGEALNTVLEKDSNYFNKLFPYTIALGIDKSWLNRMEDYELQSPHWFYTVADKPYPQSQMHHFGQTFNVEKISSVFSVSGASGSSKSFSSGTSSSGSSGGGFGGGGSSW